MRNYFRTIGLACLLAICSEAQDVSPRLKEALTTYEDALRGLADQRDTLTSQNAKLTSSQAELRTQLDSANSEVKSLRDNTAALQKRATEAEAATNSELFDLVHRIMTLVERTAEQKEALAAELIRESYKKSSRLSVPSGGATAPPTASRPSAASAAPATLDGYAKLVDTLLVEFNTQNRERDVLVRAILASKVGRSGRQILFNNPIK